MTPEEIEKSLCIGFCQSIQTRIKADGSIQVALPFVGRDGDCYNIFVAKQVDGSFKISDKGSTIMRLSYENDLKLLKGARTEVLNQIINENGVYFDNGEIYTRSLEKDLTATVFKLGQALTRISDLGLWNKARIKSTFYEDLDFNLHRIIPYQEIKKDAYLEIDREKLFPIDYLVNGEDKPLLIFGVPDSSKARLATIIMLKVAEWKINCNKMVVLNGLENIGNADLERLMDAANDFVPKVTEFESMERKIAERLLH
ncbi:DUF1828 domain-containing protein [Simonsiella muelleri]|nr:DUF1828 domain-containing protein [Simonsiella muelleri]AUX61831.1 hypothetical protein BWP33_08460 [Simonsiella muelleri ATCC 29453]UBQ53916.1 DUF1828 domain-containing protein [Simonsiella muelleri]